MEHKFMVGHERELVQRQWRPLCLELWWLRCRLSKGRREFWKEHRPISFVCVYVYNGFESTYIPTWLEPLWGSMAGGQGAGIPSFHPSF